ncbi:MAG: hypothetical protein OYG31_01510 [Candidatus Kaiserbacteria bacterium]|nr:hypothetical protein [Candidatus Kaiserbacteria bacterium]
MPSFSDSPMLPFLELIKKIELQSIAVLFFTLLFGYLLLKIENSFSSPAGILGSISVAGGLLYTAVSFISNLIGEQYKDIIKHYKDMVLVLRSSNRDIQKNYQQSVFGSGERQDNKRTATEGYRPLTNEHTKSS